ncbi:MAG TPA: PH domain-containing protein [Candidatus Saccharimonadales bacterium]|nr:PH domain-containing protein [Candidatus Saccharimonadales bacterium]
MGYVQQNLNPGERILYTTHLHWLVLFRSIFVDIIFSVAGLALIVWGFAGTHSGRGEATAAEIAGFVLVLLGSITLGIAIVRRNATEVAVTNKRIIIKIGFLTKRTIELFLSKVESVEVEQTLTGRMMGFGSITVRGTGGTNEPFSHIANPLEFRRQVQHQIEEHANSSSQSQ